MRIWDKRYFILFTIVGVVVTIAGSIYISEYLDKQVSEQQAQARLKAYIESVKADCKQQYLNHEINYYMLLQCEKKL
jgi:hypothetical protein